MIQVEKRHISMLMLAEAYAEKHKTEEKIMFFANKYKQDFASFEKQLYTEEENFTKYDDYMEWKAYEKYLQEIKNRIQELYDGNIQVA